MSINEEKIFRLIVKKELTKQEALHLLRGINSGAAGKNYSLSAGQKMLWIFNRLAPDSYSYNVPLAYRVSGDIDVAALEEAVRLVIERHPSLRTAFRMEGDSPVQYVLENPEIYFVRKDLSILSGPAAEREIKAVSREPFNLEKGPLFKTTLFTLPDGDLVLLLNFHHIVVDGVSLQIILDDFQRYYHATKGATKHIPSPQRATYEDFVLWQQEMLGGGAGMRDGEFWRGQLSGGISPLNIFFDRTPTSAPTYRGASHITKIEKPLARGIESLSVSGETTVFSVLLAAFNVLLYRYSYQEDIMVITPVAGRPENRFDEVVGDFVNMVVIRSNLSGDKEFKTLLKEVGETSLNALEHGNYPFINIVEELGRKHKINASQLFRVSFYMQNWKKLVCVDGEIFLEPYEGITQEGEFDLTLDAVPVEEGYRLCFKYNPDIFEEQTIIQMAGHYLQILEDVVKTPEKPISAINLLTSEESRKILVEWNNTAADYPCDKGFHELFDEQAERTPGAIAVIQGDRTITYGELSGKAAQMANYFQRQGVEPGSVVGVYLERSIEMLTGLLALFKAGCAFLPMDPAYPAERLSYMLENAGVRFLLTHSSLDSIKPDFGGKMIQLDTEWDRITRESSQLANRANPSGLAYIIYTSGSTGMPKGVQIPHRGLVNFLCSMKKTPGFSDRDKILSITSICFDISTMELFLPLVVGGKVEILPFLVTRDGNALRKVIENSSATFIQATPSTWRMLLASGWDKRVPAKLLCGGEALTDELAEKLLQRGEEVWNIFGPTEATVWSSLVKVRAGEKITIGRPIDNTQYYVLDSYGNPVPPGVPGELYIGGDGLAVGYMKRPDLTSASFISNHFDTTGTTKLYKTGDLVRYLYDGRVEYLGRVDNQVKLRGYRIELGEIEAALKRLEGIHASAVVVRSDSGDHKHLFAFLIPAGSYGEMPGQEIVLNLKRWLANYMIPSRFVYLKEFPLTPNRKLDRKHLSSASLSEIEKCYGLIDNVPCVPAPMEEEGVKPGTWNINGLTEHIQEDLSSTIADILKINKNEINDTTNLGEYGFDSIRFTILSERLNKKYGINVSAAVFYEYSTIKSISAFLISEFGEFVKKSYGGAAGGVEQCHSAIAPSASRQDCRKEAPVAPSTPVNVKEPVAIIGISGRMPQSSNMEEFWENLVGNRDLITEVPRNRWDWKDYYGEADKEDNKTKIIWGGFLRDVDKFDASFFGISPREAELMDPQQRLFLEVTWEAIEDAGYMASDLSGTKTGVFVGVAGFDYWQVQRENHWATEGHTLSGLAHSITANRVSYLLNLKGPSASIDTACSSSLVSVHRAVKAIQGGLCELAIAGGVNLILSPFVFIASDKGGMMSADGRCKTFDVSADGYVRGEGAGALLLKPLSRARVDGDYIYAIIRGTAENHGGRTNSLTAPNPGAQAELIMEAYEEAEVDPATVSYIETHGTGTALGDPIEVNGLKKAFKALYRKWGRPAPVNPHCGLSSVKTNIGHLEAAAGIAGVLKALLAMRHKKLPAVLHLRELNPHINLENSPFYIVSENIDWEQLTDVSGEKIPRRAGVSSFGFGGSNAHIVLEEYDGMKLKAGVPAGGPQIFVLSARNEDRLIAYAGKMAGYFEKGASQLGQRAGEAALLQQVQGKLLSILSQALVVKGSDISTDEDFWEYGLGSVGLSRFADLINEEFDLSITFDKLSELRSVRNLAEYLCREKEDSHNVPEAEELKTDMLLADVAYTLQVGREAMDKRLAIVASGFKELTDKLKRFCDGEDNIDGLYQGNARTGRETSRLLLDGKEGREFVKIIVNERKLNKLAQIWVSGANIDWRMLHQDSRPNRITLPTYPFARERYWIPEDDMKAGRGIATPAITAAIHPLLQQNTSDLSGLRFSSTFTGEEFFLADHLIKGKRVLPGVAYLEMARAAVDMASGVSEDGLKGIRLKNVVWARPIAVGDNPVQVHIGLFPEDNGEIAYEIYCEHEEVDAEPVVYSQGIAMLSTVAKAPALEIKALQAQCSQSTIYSTQCYEAFRVAGIDYGPAHQGIEKMYVGPGQVLAKLSLPSSVSDTKDQFFLHPSLLDSAIQASIGLMIGAGDAANPKSSLPFALQELEILGRCTPTMWTLIRYSDGSTEGDKVQKLDIDLCDGQGNVCVRMKGFTSRVLEGEVGSEGSPATIGTLMLHPCWEEQAIDEEATAPDYTEHLVMLCEPGLILQESIETRMSGVRCLTLQSKQKGIEERFQIYATQVFEEIQRILKYKPEGRVLIQVVISSKNEQQLFSGLNGLLKTAQLENSKLIGQLIEIEAEDYPEEIVERLKENSRSPINNHIRYQNGKRLVANLSEVQLSQEEMVIPWKDRGIYLITGGAGGLGLIFAKEIAHRVKDATLILTGRSMLNEEIKTKLKELQSLVARIEYQQVDVTQKEEVVSLIQSIQENYGGLHGIIHSAGIIQDNFILKKTKEELKEVLAPKVTGLVNLDQASKGLPVDFLILFSSGAVMGNPGQADYAAANAFMDAYAEYRNALVASKQRHGKTLSINWPLWKDGGMHLDEEIEKMMRQNTGMVAMQSTTGIRALYEGLASGHNQVMVIVGDLNRLHRTLLAQQASTALRNPSPIADNKVVSAIGEDLLREKAMNYFIKLLSSVIKLPEHFIEADAPMEEYGIDSIMAMQLTSQLEKTFGTLSKTLVFEYQNINDLTGYFITFYRDQLVELLGSKESVKSTTPQAKDAVSATESEKSAPGRPRRPRIASQRTESREEKEELDVAIIGVSGRYPQAENTRQFWENLRDGKDCITEIPIDRWDHSLYFDEDKNKPGKTYCKWGGFIEGVDQFDPLFFRISPREAEIMDPMERLFLETIWNLLEDTGYTRKILQQYYQSRVGVYVGAMYQQYHSFNSDIVKESAISLSSYSSIANRVSYYFNLQGPSIAIDTMCSSAAIAIHMACESLIKGECQIAIAGGVNLSIHPNKYLGLSLRKMLGSHINSRSFGDGDGYIPGEGVGAILLKPLSKAVRDRDSILAVIKSTAVNHDGFSNGYTVPNPNAQAQLIEDNFIKSGIDPRTISYVESSANGSALGDAIEITALNKVFQKFTTDQQFCAIGSVKANIGHTEATSGIAQLTKVILQLQHRQIVPTIKADPLNPSISFDDTPYYLQRELQEWKRPVVKIDGEEREFPRRATVSSFGAGGSNAHLIVEEYIPVQEEITHIKSTTSPQIVVFSAKNRDRLRAVIEQMLGFTELQKDLFLRDFAYTLQICREAMECRLAMVVNTRGELSQALKDVLKSFKEGKEVETAIPVFTGDLEEDHSRIKSLLSGKAEQTILKVFLEEKDFEKIALYWTQGGKIPWELLHEGGGVQKMSLPTYPFFRERFWISNHIEDSHRAPSIQHFTEPQQDFTIDIDKSTLENIQEYIVQFLSEELNIVQDQIKVKKDIQDYGVDSIIVMKLIRHFENHFQIKITGREMLEYRTINSLSSHLASKIEGLNKQEIVADTLLKTKPRQMGEHTGEIGIEALEKFKQGALTLEQIESLID